MAWGKAYENKVAKYLDAMWKDVLHEPWFEYRDVAGVGVCCPDILIVPDDRHQLLLAEVKLTATPQAELELCTLYQPVVEYLWPEHQVRLCQISLNIPNDWEGVVVNRLDDVFKTDDFCTLNLKRFPK